MSSQNSIKTEGISGTLYIPLTGNIYTSKNFRELLFDEKALELEEAIHKELYYKVSAMQYRQYWRRTGYLLLQN